MVEVEPEIDRHHRVPYLIPQGFFFLLLFTVRVSYLFTLVNAAHFRVASMTHVHIRSDTIREQCGGG